MIQTLEGHALVVMSVQFCPNEPYLVTCSWDNTTKVWSVQSDIKKSPEGHTSFVRSIHFSPDGLYLGSASLDHTAKIWSLAGHVLQTLKIHSQEVTCLSFSPDGSKIATGSVERTVKVYSITSKMVIQSFEEHSDRVMSISSTPYSIEIHQNPWGTFFSSGHKDHSVRYWQLCEVNQKPYLLLIWSSHQNALLSQNACIANVKDLSADNAELLKQRGAIDDMTQWIPPKLFSKKSNELINTSTTCNNNNNSTQTSIISQSTDHKNNCTIS